MDPAPWVIAVCRNVEIRDIGDQAAVRAADPRSISEHDPSAEPALLANALLGAPHITSNEDASRARAQLPVPVNITQHVVHLATRPSCWLQSAADRCECCDTTAGHAVAILGLMATPSRLIGLVEHLTRAATLHAVTRRRIDHVGPEIGPKDPDRQEEDQVFRGAWTGQMPTRYVADSCGQFGTDVSSPR